MPNYMEKVFAPIEALYKAQVETETWGHFAPEPGRSYPGFILFAVSAWGEERMLIDAEFEGLNDSPWLHDDLTDFIDRKGGKPGAVYRFEGAYRRLKNGGHRFTGRTRRIDCK